MINCLKSKLLKFMATIDTVKSVQQSLEAEINKRLGTIEYSAHIALPTILDQRFKNIHFQDLQVCGRSMYKLNKLIKENIVKIFIRPT